MENLIEAIVLGIVEGITEFLPISSTGHLLLCERMMGIDLDHDVRWKTFAVFIQIGAILAVVVYFRDRIMELLRGKPQGFRTPLEILSARATASTTAAAEISNGPLAVATEQPATPSPAAGDKVLNYEPQPDEDVVTPAERRHAVLMILLATVPVLVIGFLTHDFIERYMGSARSVACALLAGGVAMIIIEWLPTNVTTRRIERITWKQALCVGGIQVLAAVFPGTSRSAATIMGGLLAGLSRPAATEFSFFLAIPSMFAACGYALLKWVRSAHPTVEEILILAIGTLVSFLVAWAVIAFFMSYVRRHNFIPFAIYRIALGAIVLLLVARGG